MPPAVLELEEGPGRRRQTPIAPLPFVIGRQAECALVLRDARISRNHARILKEDDGYVIEDLGSRNGVFVNGERVRRRRLASLDRIEFGIPGGCNAIFRIQDRSLEKLAENLAAPADRLVRLRTLLDVARAMETSFSGDEVLAALVDAALAFTGAERGFLLLRKESDLEVRVARHRSGTALSENDLRVPRGVIRQALDGRKELLSMSFAPDAQATWAAGATVAELDLRSVVCLPLIRPAAATEAGTKPAPPAEATAGLIYLDSRAGEADLSGGNRELLQTLALEASMALENARLLENERARQRIEEELRIARSIQQSLLPRTLPSSGWLRAAGRSDPSHRVGGDYYDLHPAGPSAWAVINADVSGKGVSSALLASVLQGVFVAWPHAAAELGKAVERLSRFLLERTQGEKYATLFYAILQADGLLRYVNAGHCAPLLVRAGGGVEPLPATGLPVGLLEEAAYEAREARLGPGDLLVLYTDGITDAENQHGALFGEKRLSEVAARCAGGGCEAALEILHGSVMDFAEGAIQKDDMTLLVAEFAPEG